MASHTRAKVALTSVTQHYGIYDSEQKKMVPGVSSETWVFTPVAKKGGYPSDGSDEDNTYAKWTPSGRFELTVTNPDLLGKMLPGEQFYVDFTPVPETQKS